MEEKKLTDDELIKIIDRCVNGEGLTCKDCPIDDEGCDKCVFDLINRQKAEIEQAKKDYIELDLENRELRTELDKELAEHEEFTKQAKAEIERLTEVHDRTLKAVEELNAKNHGLEYAKTELQKQVDELKNSKVIECYGLTNGCEVTKQAVKDTAKEIFTELLKDENVKINVRIDQWGETYNVACVDFDTIEELAKERYGVEVE